MKLGTHLEKGKTKTKFVGQQNWSNRCDARGPQRDIREDYAHNE